MSLARAFSPFLILIFGLSACSSISIPLGNGAANESPALTGSVGKDVTVEQPLPDALAYSDAAVIGQVAGKAAFESVTEEPIDWVNGATGSTGTWKAGPQVATEASEECRAFGATVTSVRGVHRFSGVACRDQSGNLSVKSLSDEPADVAETPTAAG